MSNQLVTRIHANLVRVLGSSDLQLDFRSNSGTDINVEVKTVLTEFLDIPVFAPGAIVVDSLEDVPEATPSGTPVFLRA